MKLLASLLLTATVATAQTSSAVERSLRDVPANKAGVVSENTVQLGDFQPTPASTDFVPPPAVAPFLGFNATLTDAPSLRAEQSH